MFFFSELVGKKEKGQLEAFKKRPRSQGWAKRNWNSTGSRKRLWSRGRKHLMEEIISYETSCGGGGGGWEDEYFEDYLSEEMNWMKVCEFTREE